ncbi:MAG: phosphoserine phosphatase SerB [Burkholderiaceae bacterium]
MSRLVVQHPALSDLSVQVFSAAIGFAPDTRQSGVAIWSDVKIGSDQVTFLAERHRVDAEFVPDQDPLSDYRLIAFDMDSTLITVECIDEIAAYAGRKAEVAAITEATMRGEIRNFADSLRQRVAQLAGLPAQVLETVYREKVTLSEGAAKLIESAQLAGLKTLLVSGGFTFFTSRLAERLSFTKHRANELEIVDGHLTGRVLGDIVDGEAKRRTVIQTCSEIGCDPDATIVIGDGANDLPMMSVAGVSVAFHAKPIVRSETTHAINYGGLDGALHYFTD